MSDLICRKTMMRCKTPGMCSPHGGCQGGTLKVTNARYSAGTVPDDAVMLPIPDLGQFIDYVWSLKQERDQLRAEVEALRKSITARAPGPRSLPQVGTGALYGEQDHCFRKGWKEGVSAFRKQLRAAMAAKEGVTTSLDKERAQCTAPECGCTDAFCAAWPSNPTT